jgi:hypothetical protein
MSLVGFGQSDRLAPAKPRRERVLGPAVEARRPGVPFARTLTANLKARRLRRHFSWHCSPVSASFRTASLLAGSDELAIILPGSSGQLIDLNQ